MGEGGAGRHGPTNLGNVKTVLQKCAFFLLRWETISLNASHPRKILDTPLNSGDVTIFNFLIKNRELRLLIPVN